MKQILQSLLVGLLLMTSQVQAQQMKVAGKVTDQTNKQPMRGVSVSVMGQKAATMTDENGNYSLMVNSGTTLRFSMIGYVTQELAAQADVLNVTMEPSDQTLDQVVVVGYGTQKKANLTGAVSTINVKENLEARPIADVGRAIQGTTPGLSVVVPSGEVGSDPLIKIRGQIGSINGGSAPLILMDNVEIPSIQLINPADIESITVLKDAAAASIYGAKAAFGVVLITTKTGSGTGKPQINYTNNFAFQNPWKELKMADVNGLKYSWEAAERAGNTFIGAFYKIDGDSYKKAVAWKEKYGNTIGPDDPTVYGRDWYWDGGLYKFGVRTYDPYEAMVREWAPTQQHTLSIAGTSGKTSYNIGLGALDQSGMMKPAKKDAFSRYNASIKVNSEINKFLTVRAGALYSRRNKEYPYITSSTTADPWLYLYRWSPLYPLGNDENGDPIRSPASEAAQANTASLLYNYTNINLGGTVNITNNWRVDVDYSFSNQEHIWTRPGTRYTARNSWVAPQARMDKDGNPVYVNAEGQVVDSSAPGAMQAYDLGMETYTATGANPDHMYQLSANIARHTVNAYTTYNLNVQEDHAFKFMLGVNRVTERLGDHSSQFTNLLDITNPQFNFGIGTQTVGGSAGWEAQLGYFGRINYAYKNKYLVEANLRYDGTSKFPERLWWRWFPSFSAGWVVSEESFMEWSKSFMDQFKFRGSWGTIGDQTVPNGLYLAQMDPDQNTWISNGAKTSYVGSPDAVLASLTWQDITTLDFGLDARFLRDQLGFTFDWYQRDTKNMIVPSEGYAPTFGIEAPNGNFGSLRTTGWELAVDFNHRFESGLGINLRANISDAKSKITAYGTTQQIDEYYVGKTIGEIWGYRTDRLYQENDFEYVDGELNLITLTEANGPRNAGKEAYQLKGENPVYQAYLQNTAGFYFGPGDVKFVDLNGDGQIDGGNGLLNDHGDREIIGNENPRYEYGLRIGADYKGFDFSMFLQGVGSRQIWGNGFLAIPGYNASDGAMPAAIADNYWTSENPGAFYPAPWNNAGSNTANNMQIQTRYLLNMAYLRVKNITLGYSLPKSLLSKAYVNSLRIYAALENFITFDHLGDLPIDPEAINGYSMWNTRNYNSSRTGVGIPAFKTVSFGVQLNF